MKMPRKSLISLATLLWLSYGAVTPLVSTPAQSERLSMAATPYPVATDSPALATALASGECYQSFDTFAYQGPLYRQPQTEALLPHWQVETSFPSRYVQDLPGPLSQTENQTLIAHSHDGHPEIWVSLKSDATLSRPDTLGIYRPESKSWEVIPNEVVNTDLFVDRLFVTSDETVWGRTIWDKWQGELLPSSVPILSRFDEQTRRFEPVASAPNRQYFPPTYYGHWPEVLVDKHDIFWIVIEKDGIYRFNPITSVSEKSIELPADFELSQAVLSPDGSIYLEKYRWGGETLFRLPDNILFQFSPDAGKLIAVDMPDEAWPIFSGMLFDSSGSLWLGSIGFREIDGTWHLVHPHPDEYFHHLGDYLWAPPYLMFQSSDGVLWYRRWLDTSGWAEGTAWYDPATGEGCLLTNIAANVIEDADGQLWLVADGKLYKHSVHP